PPTLRHPHSFHRSAAHRHPPSLPTRRSSDLGRPVATKQPARERLVELARLGSAGGEGNGECLQRYARLHAQAERLAEHDVQRLRDRKSTRLNSSHRTISYAVFCLKKKTE